MTRESRDEALRALLWQGDPADDGREPSAEETARMRARVLGAASAPDAAESRTRWTPAAVAAAALFAVLVLGAVTLRISRSSPTATGQPALEAGATGEIPATHRERAPRQIQFTTPGGTRVVWMLYPEATESDSRAGRGPGGRS